MEVDPVQAAGSVEYKGQTYYFCAPGCKRAFEKEPEKYAAFWHEFGRSFKEGLATDPSAKAEILPYLRYVSSHSDGKLTSLYEYIERMPESQE